MKNKRNGQDHGKLSKARTQAETGRSAELVM